MASDEVPLDVTITHAGGLTGKKRKEILEHLEAILISKAPINGRIHVDKTDESNPESTEEMRKAEAPHVKGNVFIGKHIDGGELAKELAPLAAKKTVWIHFTDHTMKNEAGEAVHSEREGNAMVISLKDVAKTKIALQRRVSEVMGKGRIEPAGLKGVFFREKKPGSGMFRQKPKHEART
jgi:hypothetical protein